MFAVEDHVDEEAHYGVVAFVMDGFYHGVGVYDGGGLGCGDEDEFVGGYDEGDGVEPDAGHGVDDDEVEAGLDFFEPGQDILTGGVVEIGEFGEAGTAGDDIYSAGSANKDLGNALVAVDDVLEVVEGVEAEQDLDVGQAEVGVE